MDVKGSNRVGELAGDQEGQESVSDKGGADQGSEGGEGGARGVN